MALGEVAAEIGRQLDVPVEAVPDDEADDHFLWLAPIVALDTRAANETTRALLGWEPTHPGLLDDLRAGRYTDGPT